MIERWRGIPIERPPSWPLIPLGTELRRALNDAQKRELEHLLDIAAADADRVAQFIADTTGLAVDCDDLIKRTFELVHARREWNGLKRRP